MGATTGSLQKVMVGGITFNATADGDVTETLSNVTNEAIATSGENMRKMTRRTAVREGVTITCEPSEADILRGLAESLEDIPISYTAADGSVWRTSGWIEFENRTTADGKATCKFFPRVQWELFAN